MGNPNAIPPNKWKKGESGNPRGSSERQRVMGAIERMTHKEVAEIGSLLLTGNFAALKKLIPNKSRDPDPSVSLLQSWTAALIIKSMQKGDSATYERLLNRIVGKVPDVLEHSGRDGGAIVTQTKEQYEAELAALRARNEEMGDD